MALQRAPPANASPQSAKLPHFAATPSIVRNHSRKAD
jgi:hypothetical protein